MKELLVLSGKGGTGKTTVVGALAALIDDKVMADCDVDGADLHLLLRPENREQHEFWCGVEAEIDASACTACATCVELCRFHAIAMKEHAEIIPFSCEGCGVCAHFCPAGAISLRDKLSGYWFLAETLHGPLLHARLEAGEENSGKLVSLVKKKAREEAGQRGADWLLVDGPPGIGCPVIASLSGAHLVLLVTEPSVSGLHDLRRVAHLAAHFQVPAGICINKWDLLPEQSEAIERFCADHRLPVLGRIPFDRAVVAAMVQARTLPEHAPASPAAMAVHELWRNLHEFALRSEDQRKRILPNFTQEG
ncbi:MAG: ATP-binding protein [Desulfobulbaceae bacterium]